MSTFIFPRPPNALELRSELRRRILTARDALPPVERQRKSGCILEHLWELEPFTGAGLVFLYVSFRSEVDTSRLIRRCLSAGRKVAVPLTRVGEHRLEAYRLLDPDRDLQPGYCSIPEPDPQRLQRVEPATIGAVVLPGSVFDRQGGRLGYGGGYYDRFLVQTAPGTVRIALAFELQVVDQLPLLPHDQPLDYLVTETGVIELKRQGSGPPVRP